MKTFKIAAVCAFCLTILAAAASAQMGMGMRPSMPQGIFNPTVGAGAQYESTNTDGSKTSIEFAIAGKETVNGKDGYWLEWSSTSGRMGEMVMKTLIVPGATDGTTSRMIMQMAGRPPMEMSSDMMGHMGNQPSPKADIRAESENVGKESITTPAGTFSCDHYRSKDGSADTWVSSQVPVFGMVKTQGKNSFMVLIKVTSGAHDKIVGTPAPFDPQQMMQQHQ
jgi:hypothetical protein